MEICILHSARTAVARRATRRRYDGRPPPALERRVHALSVQVAPLRNADETAA
jgi:hypothetical protein